MSDFLITGAKKPLIPMVFELDVNKAPQPLVLLINPQSLDIKLVPRVQEVRTRWTNQREAPYVYHVHHDELDVLSMTCKSAMFYSNLGIDSDNREKTLAWENVQFLLAIYKNNGMNFNKKPGSRGTGVIESVGRVVLTYDSFVYRGSFENFNLTESSDQPFTYDFSFDFKITELYDIKGTSNTIMQNVLQTDVRFRI